ncbi:DUF711 family protein [Castellaniella sp.]|uniref:DUF711 family protein n=1 Tax=Castellaniella sp. TaxID=1955812 RepID=UPI003A4C7B52
MSRVDAFGQSLEEKSGIEYRGLDGSLAPFPDGVTSIGHLVELLGPSPVGALNTRHAFHHQRLWELLLRPRARERRPGPWDSTA